MKTSFCLWMCALLTLPVLLLASCNQEDSKAKRLGKGFRLPPGNVENGAVAFTALKCNACHSVKGAELPEPESKSKVYFPLGGEVMKVKSYGELVTAIIQPEHVLSPAYLRTIEQEQRTEATTPMPNFNDQMTVRQLTDLVTFLRSHYKKALPDYDDDFYYPY